MPPKRDGKHQPANIIIIGRAGQSGPTFNDTSLVPFLRAYTRMNSRDAGGGDKQFNEEFNLARRIVEENRLQNSPHEFIHDLVYSIANPESGQPARYPTLRSQGVSDQTAYQNRIIVSVLLMMHSTNDFQDGSDGGVTRGGLWLPPRLQARTAQEAAAERSQAVRYPTWSREEAQASTPSLSANWTSSGQRPSQQPHAGSLRSRGSHGVDSAVGNLPPFSMDYRPTPQSPYGLTSAGVVYGPPSAGLGGYPPYSRGPQQYTSSPSLRDEYGVPRPSHFQPQHYAHPPAPRALPPGSELLPYDTTTDRVRDLSSPPFWQPSSYGGQRAALPPPPPLEGAKHLSPFGTERNSPLRPAQAPIGSDRPQQAHHRHGGSRSGRAESACGTPPQPAPGSGNHSGGRSRRGEQGW